MAFANYFVRKIAAAAVNPEPKAHNATVFPEACCAKVSPNAIGIVQDEVLPKLAILLYSVPGFIFNRFSTAFEIRWLA